MSKPVVGLGAKVRTAEMIVLLGCLSVAASDCNDSASRSIFHLGEQKSVLSKNFVHRGVKDLRREVGVTLCTECPRIT